MMMPAWLGRLGLLSLVWGSLLLWRWVATGLGCPGAVVFVLFAVAVLTLSATEVAFYRRHAFLAHYLDPAGRLFRLLRRKTTIVVWQGLKAILMSLVLLISVLRFELLQWLVLLGDVVLMAAMIAAFSAFLRAEVKTIYRAAMARHWSLRVNAAVLWIVLVCVQFFSATENYTGLRWEDVVAYSVSQVAVDCDALAIVARINAVGEALALWAGQNLFGGLQYPTQALTAWLAFMAAVGVSFLVAWAYSRALAGIVSRPWAIWQRKPKGGKPHPSP